MAANLPSEILIEIFFRVSPADLYSLSSTCKRFRSLLWSNSNITQEIWRKSRLYKGLYVPPPFLNNNNKNERMSEQQYLWLMIVCEKCQFCDQRNKNELNLYWEGKIYCCSECLKERVISKESLKVKLKDMKVPEDLLLQCLIEVKEVPKSFDICQPKKYFISEVDNLLKEYNDKVRNHEINEINEWLETKKSEIRKLEKENELYRKSYHECRSYKERLQKVFKIISKSNNYDYYD